MHIYVHKFTDGPSTEHPADSPAELHAILAYQFS